MNPVAFEIDEKLWSVEEVERIDQIWAVSDHLLNFQIEFPSVTYCPGLDAVKATRYQECYFDSVKCFDNLTSDSMLSFCQPWCSQFKNSSSRPEKLVGFSMFCSKFDAPNLTYFKNDELRQQLEEFTKYDWMKQQSFCWNNRPKIKLKQIFTEIGICFQLNSPEILNYQT
jgi:hypothetical protein